MEASKSAERGSAKLFTLEAHDHEGIAKALGLARADYEVKWWWRYGQPAIDRVQVQFEVDGAQLGSLVNQLMRMNGREMQVTAQCFPYSTQKTPVFRIEADIRTGH